MSTVSKIAHASDIELLCITYEMFLEAVQKGIELEPHQRKPAVEQAKKVLLVLTENLNFEVAIAKELFSLYVYVQNILINYYKETEKLEEAYQLIEMIYKGYKTVEEETIKKENLPMMENTQHIYAGMTYGKGYLHEHVDEAKGRGYKI